MLPTWRTRSSRPLRAAVLIGSGTTSYGDSLYQLLYSDAESFASIAVARRVVALLVVYKATDRPWFQNPSLQTMVQDLPAYRYESILRNLSTTRYARRSNSLDKRHKT